MFPKTYEVCFNGVNGWFRTTKSFKQIFRIQKNNIGDDLLKINMHTNNRIELIGRVAAINEYSKDKAANITIAVDGGTNKDGVQKVNYIQLKSFTPASYNVTKVGMKVAVYGHIATNNYEKDGEMKYTTDLVADFVEFLESKATVEAREMLKQ